MDLEALYRDTGFECKVDFNRKIGEAAEWVKEMAFSIIVKKQRFEMEYIKDGNLEKAVNKKWCEHVPLVTVITPIYNRREEIKRAMHSVARQTFRDFEYILVDDGSTEDSDDIVEAFMGEAVFPVMYIKKPNGGVHTARNAAVREARGDLICFLDDDDEMFPYTVESFLKAWDSIPSSKRSEYRGVVALCCDQNGVQSGKSFPENINEMPWPLGMRVCDATGGEHRDINTAKCLKENLFPEPEGITLVSESIMWKKLEPQYKEWFINDILFIYHTEGEGYTRAAKKTVQAVKNLNWNTAYKLNEGNYYITGKKERFIEIARYAVLESALKKCGTDSNSELVTRKDRILYKICMIPAFFLAFGYRKNKMRI